MSLLVDKIEPRNVDGFSRTTRNTQQAYEIPLGLREIGGLFFSKYIGRIAAAEIEFVRHRQKRFFNSGCLVSMKFWKILLGVLLLAVGIFIFRACRTPTYTNLPPRATGDWVAFGDSLTAGFGASEGYDYPTLLSKNIGRKILNKGVPSETTENALGRVEEIVRLQPRVVLLCFGGNDGLQQLPMEKTFANLSAIIDRLQEGGSFVVLVGVRSASVRDRYAKSFKALAAEKHVLYVPNILSGVLGTPNLMSDYVHPNDEGYRAMAERLEKILSPILPSL